MSSMSKYVFILDIFLHSPADEFTFATDHQEAEDEAQADEEAGVHGSETEEMDHFSPILSSELSTKNLIY